MINLSAITIKCPHFKFQKCQNSKFVRKFSENRAFILIW